MKAQLIDGKRISAEIKAEAAEEAAALKAKGITPAQRLFWSAMIPPLRYM